MTIVIEEDLSRYASRLCIQARNEKEQHGRRLLELISRDDCHIPRSLPSPTFFETLGQRQNIPTAGSCVLNLGKVLTGHSETIHMPD
jgi:hypothetical protein